MYLNFVISSIVGIIVAVLVAFGVLQWFHIAAGNFLNWVIGGGSFWWLLVIMTVPWNVHFQAKEVLAEAAESIEKNIPVDEKQIKYVSILAKGALWLAIGLHLISTIALYLLAATEISAVRYISSGAALLLTLLLPAISIYEYSYARLRMIRQAFTYPREGVLELRNRFYEIEQKGQSLEDKRNLEQPCSLAANNQRFSEEKR